MSQSKHSKQSKSNRWLNQQNEQSERLRIEQEAQQRQAFDTFDEYVKVFPEGEHFRNWVGNGILIPTYESGCTITGEYYTARIMEYPKDLYPAGKGLSYLNGTVWIYLNDCDDGSCQKQCKDIEDAKQELEKLKLLAPFYYWNLKDYGYDNFN